MAHKRSWQEKLHDSKNLPKVGKIEGAMTKRWGTGTMVVPAPVEVDALMRKVPKGKLVTINELRGRLAENHGATIGCPMTTGIFAWIAAHAADEQAAEGKKRITPYWRTLKTGGELNPKFPGGIANLKRRLEAEGHRVVQRGKRFVVVDYDQALARLYSATGLRRTIAVATVIAKIASGGAWCAAIGLGGPRTRCAVPGQDKTTR